MSAIGTASPVFWDLVNKRMDSLPKTATAAEPATVAAAPSLSAEEEVATINAAVNSVCDYLTSGLIIGRIATRGHCDFYLSWPEKNGDKTEVLASDKQLVLSGNPSDELIIKIVDAINERIGFYKVEYDPIYELYNIVFVTNFRTVTMKSNGSYSVGVVKFKFEMVMGCPIQGCIMNALSHFDEGTNLNLEHLKSSCNKVAKKLLLDAAYVDAIAVALSNKKTVILRVVVNHMPSSPMNPVEPDESLLELRVAERCNMIAMGCLVEAFTKELKMEAKAHYWPYPNSKLPSAEKESYDDSTDRRPTQGYCMRKNGDFIKAYFDYRIKSGSEVTVPVSVSSAD